MKWGWILLCMVVLLGGSLWASAQEKAQEVPAPGTVKLVNPFEVEGNWYKTALHVHSNTSDGDVPYKERIQQYRDKGFDVVAITDHWKTNDISGLSSENFLVISGMEFHPKGNHFVGINVPFGFNAEQYKEEPQKAIDAMNAAGAVVFYAHPYWLGHTLDDMLSVNGYAGMEVYNSGCELGIGKGYNDVHWQQLLEKGHILSGVATDDVHNTQNVGLAWTMIKAKKLTVEAVLDSLRTGSFYASCGPVIKDFKVENGVAKVECSKAAEIRFISNQWYSSRVEAKKGKSLKSAEWKLPKECKFIRVEVVDKKGKSAWTNPIVLK